MLFWKALVFPPLRCALAFGLLDGSDAAPPKTLEVTDDARKKLTVPNPSYSTWVARDQFVQGWLNNSLSPDILAHVLDKTSTAETWSTISALFASASKAKVSHLRTTLNNTKKKEMTVEKYLSKMMGFRSELAAARKIIDDDEMISYITAGLDGKYNVLVDRVDNTPGISLDDVMNQVSAFDMRQTLLSDTEDAGPFVSSANLSRRDDKRRDEPRRDDYWRRDERRRDDDWPRDDRHRDDMRRDEPHRDDKRREESRCDNRRRDEPRCDEPRGYWRREEPRRDDSRGRDGGGKGHRGRDRTPTPFVDVRCQICTIYGHPANECWWRYKDDSDDDGDRNDKAVHAAAYGIDTNWYSDTGATDHITGALNKFSMHDKYQGRDRVHTADDNDTSSTNGDAHIDDYMPLHVVSNVTNVPQQAPQKMKQMSPKLMQNKELDTGSEADPTDRTCTDPEEDSPARASQSALSPRAPRASSPSAWSPPEGGCAAGRSRSASPVSHTTRSTPATTTSSSAELASGMDSEEEVMHASTPPPPPPPPMPPTLGPRTRLQRGEPSTRAEALEDSRWRQAMHHEYNSLMLNKTWHLVPPSSTHNLIDCKWVYRVKKNADGIVDRYKERLVAKGFKQ
ncbi:hypothetical protein QYE76_036957 [Lolium multiflorum]|uniref:Reverse transcriptase Ty1/copia-type domain-containing protein n=1 Tax=Lolium multiflorum TaxID=4521 RepID=A0AAD8R4J2_LOLMU|nr:hypothetical protein QYE76_036957 [Lolium multiflorum]